jgi:hypothetical protein
MLSQSKWFSKGNFDSFVENKATVTKVIQNQLIEGLRAITLDFDKSRRLKSFR